MKNLNLNNYGVQDMNVGEMILQNGGGMAGTAASYYMTSDQMNAVGAAIRNGIATVGGFISGFLGI
jgi:hypothetical protein